MTAPTATATTEAPVRLRRDTRVVLQSVWIFAVLNYLYCDLLGLMHAPDLQAYLDGNIGGIEVTTGFLLGAGVLMEMPILMVLVSRLARRRVARIASIAAGSLMTLVQLASLGFGSETTPHYYFFSLVEVSATAFIVWTAWQWRTEV